MEAQPDAGLRHEGLQRQAADIKKIDDYTVEVTTPAPNPILPREWAFLYIMSKTWSEKNKTTEATNIRGDNQGNYANLHANGTGPSCWPSASPT